MKTINEFRLFLFSGLKSWSFEKYFFIILFNLLLSNLTFSQEITPFGLEGKVINDIKFYNGYLFAATDSGIYSREAGNFNSEWIHIGLENKKVNVVYPHDVGPVGWTITAGISPAFTPDDSALIYCFCDSTWTITDSGIGRSETTSIVSIDGFPSAVICGETFAAGNGKLFRRGINTWYEEVFSIGLGPVNIIRTSLVTGDVWIGGETGFFSPYISKSTDLGDTWSTSFPDLGGDNACNSIEFVPYDTNVVFAGMEGLVIKTVDGGITWDSTGLTNTPYYFYGLAYNSFYDILYAGGSTNSNEFGLYYSSNRGVTWAQVQTEENYKGISNIIVAPTPILESYTLYIATFGDGVFWLQPLLPGVGDEDNLIQNFELYQNYPNPFNPATNIGFRIADFGLVTLKIYDVLGREIVTFVNEVRPAGEYEVEFDASKLSSGIYYYQLRAGDFVETKKMILLK